MFEYQDDFLMTPHTDPQIGFGFCCASNLAEDQLSALADLVGTGQTLHPAGQARPNPLPGAESRDGAVEAPQTINQQTIQMVDDAPALEFDLEQELAQAFEQQMGVQSSPAPVPPAPVRPAPVMTEPVAAATAAISLENLAQDAPSPANAFDKVLLRDTSAAEAVAPVLPELDLPQAAVPVSDPMTAIEPVPVAEPDLEIDLDGALEAALDAELSMELEKALEDEALMADQGAPGPVETPAGDATAVNSADMASILAAMPQNEASPAAAPTVANVFGGLNTVSPAAAETTSQAAQPMDDFRRELSRLMGGGDTAAAKEVEPETVPQAQASPIVPGAMAEVVAKAPMEPEPLVLPEFDGANMQELSSPATAASAEVDDLLAAQPVNASAAHAPSDGLASQSAAAPLAAGQPNFAPQNDFGAHDPVFDNASFSDPAADMAPVVADTEMSEADNDNRRRKGIFAAAVVGAIALLGGAAAIGLSSFGGDGPAPEILASSEPVKVKPAEAGGQVVPNQDQAVFQSDADKPVNQATLNESAEKPIAVALNNGGSKNEDRITTGDTGTAVTSRRVRTVVVRPDGTIVSNSADGAPSAAAPQVQAPTLALQPVVPEAAPVQPVAPRTVTYNAPTGDGNAPSADGSTAAPKPQQVAKLEAKPVKVEPVKVKPAPAPKPVAKKPAPKPAATAQSASGLPSVSSPYAVQIASQRSADAAKRSYSTLSRRYAAVLRGKGVDIRRAVIDGRGTFYRVRIPAQSRGEANTLCRRLKANGGSCFVTR
ncbi:MAG: SPOR domain-containing protein [Pseudomonadota bacterium]